MTIDHPFIDQPVCAHRVLESSFGPVEVWMGIPALDPVTENYLCRYHIKGPRTDRTGHCKGVDAFQALQLALERIGTDLMFSEEGQTGELRWLDTPYEVGFPVPDNIRDLVSVTKG